MSPTDEELAQAMFNAYNEAGPTPWLTFDGRSVPRWAELNDAVRGKWVAAARCARFELVTVYRRAHDAGRRE